ncbi:MAG: glycosyltransferase [Bacteroidia bacterium]
MKFNYLSHGKYITGGFLHEKFYAESLLAFLRSLGYKIEFKQIREHKFFDNWFAHLQLLFFGLKHSNADINLLVSRFALPALIKAIFSNNKYILVFHYEDERDNSSIVLKYYFKLFFVLLNLIKTRNFAILVVAPFWETYFRNKVNDCHVIYFPNLFNLKEYNSIKVAKKVKQIHLGQWSWKNDYKVFELANRLTELGYNCYFSTNNTSETGRFNTYEIIAENRESYLKRMAESTYTIAFTSINEGWNRVAHESILLGTNVIGFNLGGLGDLLKESNSFIVDDVDQALDIIISEKTVVPPDLFINKYSDLNAGKFLDSSIQFVRN